MTEFNVKTLLITFLKLSIFIRIAVISIASTLKGYCFIDLSFSQRVKTDAVRMCAKFDISDTKTWIYTV